MDKNMRESIMSIDTLEELDELFELAKSRWGQLVSNMTNDFREGDRVWFWTSKNGPRRKIHGEVIRVNQKTVSVQPDGSKRYWRVGPTLLHKEE